MPHDQKPKWEIVQHYEQEVRKKAYQWVRPGDAPTIEEALLKAIKDPKIMNLHFVIPVTTSVASIVLAQRRPSSLWEQFRLPPKAATKGRAAGATPR